MRVDTLTRRPDPSGFAPDALTEVTRSGARNLFEQAIEAELATLLAAFSAERPADGRARPGAAGAAWVLVSRCS